MLLTTSRSLRSRISHTQNHCWNTGMPQLSRYISANWCQAKTKKKSKQNTNVNDAKRPQFSSYGPHDCLETGNCELALCNGHFKQRAMHSRGSTLASSWLMLLTNAVIFIHCDWFFTVCVTPYVQLAQKWPSRMKENCCAYLILMPQHRRMNKEKPKGTGKHHAYNDVKNCIPHSVQTTTL